MPQINRIRVNNVKYNFGTQVYDDFVMRFNCQNTIYDLANGGGKSLLMLLLMQNMLPNCTLDDKQPIEKLFRQGSGNTCIHSLVEWKLDPCYQKDGFRFMTTGFCARKGRGTDDENQDGQEQTAAPTASVEYFNYCIFYREFGDNDIKNLPLVSNGERITYNGLKAYLRDLEKSGYKYVVKIFDRKGDYQSFISNYGIYESAWEIVRGINKTEGHVRTYFESNYKTSRKVVEDLLIEEIIQKSFNNKLSVDNDEGMMAQTLMDIKDKLVELSKKHSQLGAYDSQIAAIDSFKEYLSTYEAFYNRKEEIEKQLYDLLLVAMSESDKKDKELKSQDDLITKMYDELAHEKEAIAVAEVMSEKNSMAGVESLVNETTSIDKKYERLKGLKADVDSARNRIYECEEAAASANSEYDTARDFEDSTRKAYDEIIKSWEEQYAPYYDENVSIEIDDDTYRLDKDEIESRFTGLKTALSQKNSDFADKQALMNHLSASMNKCRDAIEYRGYTFDDIKAKYEAGEIMAAGSQQLRNAKDALNNLVKSSDSVREELESQEALLNRLEGSIAHGINQIENNYGSFNEFPCDDPDGFITQHKVLIKKLEDNTKVQEKTRRQMSDSLKDILVCRKDLERIVSDAGMHVPEEFRPEDAQGITANLTEYEAVHKEYASITRLEYKKVDEFNKNKSKLIDLLNGFNAVELADEVRISLNVPENVAKTRSMIESLNETNTFIQLEKDRIAKGIEDMQMIKDNFENRCIQTCSNIKTELDRLPQLSNINLDGEQIAIISLQIPYIKEELYKEKMSEYIDETVFMAESFKEPAERLKYIRNRLSWKRLFSVIVTDMNSIRINLYKRERIKDQSRYLRYEEAVGSTGQSQGIYIQFLIAIINYISNMNSSGNEGVEGKTIFIDNPFGAAKDIYIWEPIFKLLATNHVQLIVPARGATPAITGRFDVNYILGQKLVDSRQQTVVVDYYSSTKESELEYTRMDYEQATFDFL